MSMKSLIKPDQKRTPPIRLCSTIGLTREQWLKERRRGLGGSDAPTVCGVNPWKTPFALWLERTDRAPADDLSDNEAVHFGTVLEPIVAAEFELRTGLKVQRRNAIFQSPENPFMIADVDRVIVGQNAGLECKTTSVWNAEEWDDGKVPDNYMLQVQHYISVMGWDKCYIACLIGGQTFVWHEIRRDDNLIALLVEAESKFWLNHVLNDRAPEVVPTDNIGALFPLQQRPELLEADSHMQETAAEIRALDKEQKAITAKIDTLKNELKLIIGENAGIQGVCTWKQSKDRVAVDWKQLALDTLAQIGETATPELLESYTTTKPGERRFLMTKPKEDK